MVCGGRAARWPREPLGFAELGESPQFLHLFISELLMLPSKLGRRKGELPLFTACAATFTQPACLSRSLGPRSTCV